MPRTLYVLALAVFVMGTSEFMLAGLVPAIADDLDVGVGTAGLLTSSFAIGMVVGAPLMAAFSRTWPPRRTLLLCLLVFAGCHVLAALAPALPLLVVARAVSALANAGFLAVALSTAGSLVPAHRTGRAVSVLVAGTTASMILGVPAGALLGGLRGWRTTFWTVALLCVPAVIGILRWLPRGCPRAAADIGAPGLRAELAALRGRDLLLAIVLAALVNGGTFAAFTFLAPIVTEVAGMGERWVPVVLLVFGSGSFVGVTLAGRMADARPDLLLGIGGPLLTAGWITLASVAGTPLVLLVLVFVQGVLSFAVGSTLVARVLAAGSEAPRMRGAYATSALNLGAAAGPALGALVLTHGAGASGPMWVAVVLSAVAVGTMVATARRPVADARRTAS
ncbi:Cmx/CmrA family chloramphenicol efflux MFS transporter [Brachybacterium sp. AOP25-B2-12]|uniref:Cmx/CmrA family chloramphenicol efflux MFS transporter n=1 Tax=Brachybacterium sp. AOP25-B2-12 TaxID=3457710 RepID=UPI004034CCEE